MPKKANPPRGQAAGETKIQQISCPQDRSQFKGTATSLRADIQDCGDCLTEKQREILRAIAHFFHLNSYGVSQRELIVLAGVPGTKSLQAELAALRDAGYCNWINGEERTLHLTPRGRLFAGEVSCWIQDLENFETDGGVYEPLD